MKEMKKRFARPIDTYLHKTFNTFIIYVHWKLKFHTFDSTNNHLTTERFVFLSHSPLLLFSTTTYIFYLWQTFTLNIYVFIGTFGERVYSFRFETLANNRKRKKEYIKLNSLVKQHAWSHVQLSFNYWKLWDNYNRKVCCFCFI